MNYEADPGCLRLLIPRAPKALWIGRRFLAWRRFALWAALFLACFGLAERGWADWVSVKLHNGDRLTGQLVSQDTNQVTIATGWSKGFSIPRSEIESVKTIPPPPAPGATNAAAGVTNAPAAPPSATRAAGAKSGPAPATNAVPVLTAALRPTLPQALKDGKIHGTIQVGTDVEIASRSQAVYYGKIKLSYSRDIFHNYIEYNASYGITQDVVSDNRMDGALKSDFDLNKRFYVYNLISGGYNQIQLIRSQYEVGPGFGYHVYKARDKVFDVELGADYQVRQLLTQETDRRFFARIAELYAWQVTARVSVDEKVEYFPQTDNPGQYQLRCEGNIHYNLLKHLTLNLSAINIYDTEPAQGAQHNDLQLHSSVGVTF
jgi:putative salt-induced outer membrane protein YdiY